MKTVFHWSSGKDSALALHYLLQNSPHTVDHLVTTINDHYERVTMHGTPYSLLKKQIQSMSIDHSLIRLPESASMEVYEKCMEETMQTLSEKGFTQAAFGDIFLEDLRAYREKEMLNLGFRTVFPLWKKDTSLLIEEFIDLDFKAVIVSANNQLGSDFLGETIDQNLIKNLPKGIDPCGENGEFHTFCYDGPIFDRPIEFEPGEKIKRSYPNPSGDGSVDFWFMDLIG